MVREALFNPYTAQVASSEPRSVAPRH